MLAGLAAAAMIGAGSVGAARPTDAERMEKALKGYVAGKEVDCIAQFPTLRSTSYDAAILYEAAGRTLYLNRFDGHCRIGPDTIIVTRTYSSQLCRGDIARLANRAGGFPMGSCVFGKFTTYSKPKVKAADQAR